MDQQQLRRIKTQRLDFLRELYLATDGGHIDSVPLAIVAERLSIDNDTADRIMTYLQGEGLAEFTAMLPEVGITHRGIVEVERLASGAEEAREPGVPINVIHIGNMIGSQIQQASHGSDQQQDIHLDLHRVRQLVAAVEDVLPELPLDEAARDELTAELATVRAQLQSSKPKTKRIAESLHFIHGVLAGVATNVVAARILPMFGPAFGVPL